MTPNNNIKLLSLDQATAPSSSHLGWIGYLIRQAGHFHSFCSFNNHMISYIFFHNLVKMMGTLMLGDPSKHHIYLFFLCIIMKIKHKKTNTLKKIIYDMGLCQDWELKASCYFPHK